MSFNDFSKARVGDTVESYAMGAGVIESIQPGTYPIVVRFSNQTQRSYTFDGFYNIIAKRPDLFWGGIQVEGNEPPKRKTTRELKVWVSLNNAGGVVFAKEVTSFSGLAKLWRDDGRNVIELTKTIEVDG